jgi:two-component system, NarL family, sensor histidine kinase UhpB
LSLRARLNLFITVLFLLALMLGVVLVIHNTRRAVQDELESTAHLTLQLLGDTIVSSRVAGTATNDPDLVARINALGNVRHLCVAIYDEQGQPSPRSRDCTRAKRPAVPAWFQRIVAPEALEFRRSLEIDDARRFEIVVRADPSDEISEAWQEASALLILMVGFWAAANVLVFITLGVAVKPIDTILEGLDGIERGDYRRRLPAFKLPEFTRISASFNHMADALETSRAENRTLTQKTLAIQEQERRVMARELHDELGQCLSAVKADAVTIAKWSNGVAPQVYESAQAIVSVSSRVFEIIRGMIKRLRPAALDELGLIITLGQTIDEWNLRHPDRFCRFTTRGDVDLNALDETVNIHLYRIVQEGLANVERHAQAREVAVLIQASTREDRLLLKITDDGQGFEPRQPHHGLGLLGIRERADALGGGLEIETAPSAGTTIKISVPLERVKGRAPELS